MSKGKETHLEYLPPVLLPEQKPEPQKEARLNTVLGRAKADAEHYLKQLALDQWAGPGMGRRLPSINVDYAVINQYLQIAESELKMTGDEPDEYIDAFILTCRKGWLPASGKTEFISEYLMDQGCLIFDGILPSEDGAKIKIGHILKAKKSVKVYAVWPEDFKQAYSAFLHRDRKFSDEHFFEKHASARRTLLWIAENYSSVEIKLFKNAYLEGDLSFTELEFSERKDLIVYLIDNQYNKEDIIKLVTE